MKRDRSALSEYVKNSVQRDLLPPKIWNWNLPGGVAEREWMRASQCELYHEVELDALYQNIYKIRSQSTGSRRKYGIETFPEE